jgi:hypothetical protein
METEMEMQSEGGSRSGWKKRSNSRKSESQLGVWERAGGAGAGLAWRGGNELTLRPQQASKQPPIPIPSPSTHHPKTPPQNGSSDLEISLA